MFFTCLGLENTQTLPLMKFSVQVIKLFRSDPHVILTLEKAIMRGKPVLLRNCQEHIDNIITPLMHHRNTAKEDDKDEGMESFWFVFCSHLPAYSNGTGFLLP